MRGVRILGVRRVLGAAVPLVPRLPRLPRLLLVADPPVPAAGVLIRQGRAVEARGGLRRP